MRIALAQIVSSIDPQRNLALVADAAAQAAKAGARIVVLPEATMCAFGVVAGAGRAAAGRTVGECGAGAFPRSTTSPWWPGCSPPAPGGRVRNTLLATGRGVEACYDKIHLFDAFGFRESKTVAPGRRSGDHRRRRRHRGLGDLLRRPVPGPVPDARRQGCGADPAAGVVGAGPGKREQWDLLTRAAALDSTTFLLRRGAGGPGRRSGFRRAAQRATGIGGSVAICTVREVIAELDEEARTARR